MQEIADGIHHWTAYRDTIGAEVSSYWVRPAGIITDPMVPEEGLDAFADDGLGPQQVVLSTGLHTREAARIAQALAIPIRAPREARDRLGDRLAFEPYRDGEEIAPGVQAVHIGVLAPDEYALHIAAGGGAILFADALHHDGDTLGFFSDELLGDDPQAVKDGLRRRFEALLERDFEHLLFAHGTPIVGTGKQQLRDFLAA
jgi:hypothetical protein